MNIINILVVALWVKFCCLRKLEDGLLVFVAIYYYLWVRKLGCEFWSLKSKVVIFSQVSSLLKNTRELKFWRYSSLPSFDYLLLLFFTRATLRSKFRVTRLPIFYQNLEQQNKPYIKLADRSLLYCLKKGGQMRILLH